MISVCNGLQGCVTGFKKVIFSPIALGFKIKELVCNVLSRLGLALSHASKLVFKKPISFVYKPKKGKSTNTKNGLVSRTTNQVDSINAKVFNSNALVNKKTGSINVFNKKT